MKPVIIKSILTVLCMLVVLAAYLGWLDTIAERYTQQGLKRTLITYGVARGLNGVISVAQGTELAIEPAGVGLTFTPGQILDPVNDLIERFSWVVLASGASLGVQGVLLQITSWLWFTALIVIVSCVSILLLWRDQLFSTVFRRIMYKTTLVLMIVRFSIPIIAIMNETLYEIFLAPQYIEAEYKLQKTVDDIEKISDQSPPDADASIMDKVKNIYNSASHAVDISGQLDLLKTTVEEVSENALHMIVVFVVQTLIFPLLFMWLTLQILKSVIKFRWPV